MPPTPSRTPPTRPIARSPKAPQTPSRATWVLHRPRPPRSPRPLLVDSPWVSSPLPSVTAQSGAWLTTHHLQTRGNTGEGQTAKTPAQLAEETKQTTGNVLSNAAATAQACALHNASLSLWCDDRADGFPYAAYAQTSARRLALRSRRAPRRRLPHSRRPLTPPSRRRS